MPRENIMVSTEIADDPMPVDEVMEIVGLTPKDQFVSAIDELV